MLIFVSLFILILLLILIISILILIYVFIFKIQRNSNHRVILSSIIFIQHCMKSMKSISLYFFYYFFLISFTILLYSTSMLLITLTPFSLCLVLLSLFFLLYCLNSNLSQLNTIPFPFSSSLLSPSISSSLSLYLLFSLPLSPLLSPSFSSPLSLYLLSSLPLSALFSPSICSLLSLYLLFLLFTSTLSYCHSFSFSMLLIHNNTQQQLQHYFVTYSQRTRKDDPV